MSSEQKTTNPSETTQNPSKLKMPKKPNMERKKGKRKEQKGRGGLIETDPIAGTRDFPPSEMRIQTWLFTQWRRVARAFGFEEYDAPILERVSLYKRKGGDEIVQQMYNFKDKSDLEVTLRPEMTPTLSRLVLQQEKTLIFPIKWFSIPQCWRYENMSKGRKREHYQWNMDIWGVPTVTAEAELLAAIVTFFKNVGFKESDVVIKISSRKILQSILESFGIKGDDFVKTCVIVDKLDKLEEDVVIKLLTEIGIKEDVGKKILKIMKMKSVEDIEKEMGTKIPAMQEVKDLWDLAKYYGYQDWIVFDPSVVRGLSYYTGIVFEAVSKSSTLQRAICGGGRYDTILETFGAKKNVPACGFGFGDCVIVELLREQNKLPKLEARVDDVVIPFNEELRGAAIEVASKLRESGRAVDIMLTRNKKIGQSYSYADRVGAERVILIAPDEWQKKYVRVKYLRESSGVPQQDQQKGGSTNQYDVKVDEICTWQRPKSDTKSENGSSK